MHAFALMAPLLVAAALLSGCMLPFCGTTTYVLTGVTASASFEDEAWDASRAEAGLRAAGFEPRSQAEWLVSGGNATLSMGANGSPSGTRLYVSYAADARANSQAGAEEAAQEIIGSHEADARALMAAFEEASGWTLDTEMTWDPGVLHGDC